jgi:Flp pilus assembly protein TadD
MRESSEQCWRALFFDKEQEYAEYIEAMTRNVAEDRTDYVSLNNRGVAYFEMGKPELALQDLRAACKLACQEAAPFLNLSDVLKRTGDLREALDAATEAIRIQPNESSCYFVRADIYRQLGDNARAREDTNNGNKLKTA